MIDEGLPDLFWRFVSESFDIYASFAKAAEKNVVLLGCYIWR